MTKCFVFLSLLGFCGRLVASEILMVADEIPAMEVLAGKLAAGAGYTSRIVTQKQMPSDLAPFKAVMVYIHGNLANPAEEAFIRYANAGGKLILLHHSISSGKRKNPRWFSFLGIELPAGDVNQGGYQWIEPATLVLVNRAPRHYLTTHQVKYETSIPYRASEANPTSGQERNPAEDRHGDTETQERGEGSSQTAKESVAHSAEKLLPGIVFEDSEVYLNHTFRGPRTVLMGLKYTDLKTGKTYCQDTAAWYRPAGKGWLMYFMPGHTARDFENVAYAQILVNAVQFTPQ